MVHADSMFCSKSTGHQDLPIVSSQMRHADSMRAGGRSVDGLHQQDLEFYVGHNPYGTLAALSAAGTTFTNASTSAPSDSFPGVLALHTGAPSGPYTRSCHLSALA